MTTALFIAAALFVGTCAGLGAGFVLGIASYPRWGRRLEADDDTYESRYQ